MPLKMEGPKEGLINEGLAHPDWLSEMQEACAGCTHKQSYSLNQPTRLQPRDSSRLLRSLNKCKP